MHDVLASLKEAIKSHEQSVGGDFPLVLGLSLVVKVGIFELVADINGKVEFVVGFFWLFAFDEAEDFLSIDFASALIDDGVADLSDQDDES